VVVKNHSSELRYLRGRERIHFAEGSHARGILEGIANHGFLDAAETGRITSSG
jgi:sucrose-phosphate synthase